MYQKGFAPIILIIVVLAAIASVAYYLGSKNTAKKALPPNVPAASVAELNLNPTPAGTPTALPSPTSDPTYDWRNFENFTAGYSVKYPRNLYHLVCIDEPGQFYLIKGASTDPVTIDSCPRDSRYEIEIVFSKNPINPPAQSEYFTLEKTDYDFSGQKAVKYIQKRKPSAEGPGPVYSLSIQFSKAGVYYEAYTGDPDIVPVLEQMLSTFKFLE